MSSGECRKFDPNIFNKNKCSNCYKLRELHSEAALEVNKATRTVARCGYLFVAPDWDFTNPVYRTKRWQRRWFVLYDDGELTYSIDDHPETIPQAVINMGNVFEITAADAITGNTNSIAIVAAAGIHFIKGSCAEESRLWLDILRLFSQTSTNPIRKEGATGRAKRSATFPGISRLSALKPQIPKEPPEPEEEEEEEEEEDQEDSDDLIQAEQEEEEDYRNPIDQGEDDEDEEEEEEEEEIKSDVEYEEESSDDEEAVLAQPDVVPRGIGDVANPKPISSIMKKRSSYINEPSTHMSVTSIMKKRELSPPPLVPTTKVSSYTTENTSTAPLSSIMKKREASPPPAASSYTDSSTSSLPVTSIMKPSPTPTTNSMPTSLTGIMKKKDEPVLSRRGIPDGGCGAATAAAATALSTIDVKEKNGWLMKETSPMQWHKYWFVLKDGALMYYRDPSAELKGFLDGVIGLNTVEDIGIVDPERHFGFFLKTSDGRKYKFSAVTAGIRQKWVDAVKSMIPQEDKRKESNVSNTEIATSRWISQSKSKIRYKYSMDEATMSAAAAASLLTPVADHLAATGSATHGECDSDSAASSQSSVDTADIQPPSLHDKLLSLHTQLDTQKDLLADKVSENFKLRRQTDQLDQKLQEANMATRLENEKVIELLQENAQLNRNSLEQKVNAEKWKDLYESICIQFDKCKQKSKYFEHLNSKSEEQLIAKDTIISDLSDQLQESEDRIQDLITETDLVKGELMENKAEYKDSLSKVMSAVESHVAEKMLFSSRFNESSTSAAGTDILMPDLDMTLAQYMESEFPSSYCPASGFESGCPVHSALSELFAKFKTGQAQICALKKDLQEMQKVNDSVEIEKMCLEQAFKRAIKVNEAEEKMLVERIQDLTNKLVMSEKSLRMSGRERKSSRSSKRQK